MLKIGYPWHHFQLFSVFFKQPLQFPQQIDVKNVKQKYIAGIRTLNLQIMSLLL